MCVVQEHKAEIPLTVLWRIVWRCARLIYMI